MSTLGGGRASSLTEGLAAREVGFGGRGRKGDDSVSERASVRGERGVSPVTLQPPCVRIEEGEERETVESRERGGGLRRQSGVQPHRDGSDGRDVVGGGCTPLLARAPATNDHPWSVHGGFIRQVRPTPNCRCCRCCCCHRPRRRPSSSLSSSFVLVRLRPPVASATGFPMPLPDPSVTDIGLFCQRSSGGVEARERCTPGVTLNLKLDRGWREEEGRVRFARESQCETQ